MTITNWITIVSACIVAIGWFVTGYLNRSKDVAQERLKYRLEALKSFLPVWFKIQANNAPFADPEFLPLIEKARSNFQLYCYQDEIIIMGRFIAAVEQQNLPAANVALNELVPLVRNRIRKELKIKA